MLDVCLCHSRSSAPVAEAIVNRLERCAEAKVWLEETDSSATLVDVWEGGLSSAAIILLLDSQGVPSRVTRSRWDPVLRHFSGNLEPPIACVRIGDPAYPHLLERKNFYFWQNETVPVLRAIEEWILSLHTLQIATKFEPARLPWFASREAELNEIWEKLVDSGGGLLALESDEEAGKTALAQEFVRRASGHFRDVLWIGCGDRSEASILGELADQLGTNDTRTIPELLAGHRLLLVLDDLQGNLPVLLPERCHSSVLLTVRNSTLDVQHRMPLRSASAARDLCAPPNPIALELWQAMAVCAPQGFPTSLAASIGGIEPSDAKEHLDSLIENHLVDPLDAIRVRLSRQSRLKALQTADPSSHRRKHAAAIHAAYADRSSDCNHLVAEIRPALVYACDHDWPTANELAKRATDFFRHSGRNAEAVEILKLVLSCAERRNDRDAVQLFEWELSWLVDADASVRIPGTPNEQLQFSFSA